VPIPNISFLVTTIGTIVYFSKNRISGLFPYTFCCTSLWMLPHIDEAKCNHRYVPIAEYVFSVEKQLLVAKNACSASLMITIVMQYRMSHKVIWLGAKKKTFLIIAERCPGKTSDTYLSLTKNIFV
jgi:hypothetical protein